jgi:hypothetical protein
MSLHLKLKITKHRKALKTGVSLKVAAPPGG